jgi:hypothetical protein
MAIVQISSAPSREVYDAVERVLRLSDDRPDGMIVHAATEQADGTVLLVDVWESERSMDAFEQDRLLPTFAAMPGGPMPQAPTRQVAFHLVRS